MNNINKKLSNIIFNFKGVEKDSFNPHFKSKHMTLQGIHDGLLPLCNEYGVYYNFTLESKNEKSYLNLNIIDIESGENIQSQMILPTPKNHQDFGSIMTYYMRYMLCAAFNIRQPDDDGEKAMSRVKSRPIQITDMNKEPTEIVSNSPVSLESSIDQIRHHMKKVAEAKGIKIDKEKLQMIIDTRPVNESKMLMIQRINSML